MIYALKERIGKPDLFCGREREMNLLMNWVDLIPKELAKSHALLGRRKTGKTAIMQRLFNILWDRNSDVVPFYFEVLDKNDWLLDFADKYYRTFLTQYLSFLTRTPLPSNSQYADWDEIESVSKSVGSEYMLKYNNSFQRCLHNENSSNAIDLAFGAPSYFAGCEKKFFLVMIDEIQYMTEYIYVDKDKKYLERNLPGAFHGLVEQKIAPMLVSGSYIGWMTQMMTKMFVGGRLKQMEIPTQLDFMAGLEAVYKYADFYEIEITDEVAYVINNIIQSDPFYMATLFRSEYRDFSSVKGVINTFINEIKDVKSELNRTWLEYINLSIDKVNDKFGKKILLFLSKNRDKMVPRDEILKELGWSEEREGELESKLEALKYGGLITQGVSSYHYRGIQDNILDMIFREKYLYEIYRQKPDTESDLKKKVSLLEHEVLSLKGTINELKGRMLELIVWRELNSFRKKNKPFSDFKKRLRPMPDNDQIKAMIESFEKIVLDTVWINYYLQSPEHRALEIDALAETKNETGHYALIFECKNKDEKNLPSMDDARLFANKLKLFVHPLQNEKKPISLCPVYLSANGFDSEVENWLHEQGILTADITTWGI